MQISTVTPFLATDVAERHRLYADLNRSGPVNRVVLPHGESAWLVTGYDQARAALVDPRFAKIEPPFADQLNARLRRAVNSNMLNVDGLEHGRLRKLVAPTFTRRRVELLTPRIEQLTAELLRPILDRPESEPFDLITDFAYPLPLAVICELLGVPEESREKFRKWAWADVHASLIGLDAYASAVTEFVDYLHALIETKRAAPGDDLTSALVAARDGEDRLTEDELTSTMYLLLIAGHETTVNLIANSVHLLLNADGAWAALADEPDRVPAVIEEVLRLNGPFQTSTLRAATEAFEFGGVSIAKGDTVLVGLLAAGRDTTGRSGADRFDPAGAEHRHLAFGHGIHLCLGAPLARLEAKIALTDLVTRMPALRLASAETTAEPGLLINGLAALPVTRAP